MAEAYAQGRRCAFTADGPRGPNMIAKPGPAQLAWLTGAPWVGTFAILPDRAWELNSWDRFLIPKPFARVHVAFAPQVPSNTQNLQSAIQAALDESVKMAARGAVTS